MGESSVDALQQLVRILQQTQQQQIQIQQQQQQRHEEEKIDTSAIKALEEVGRELKQFHGQNVSGFIRLYVDKMLFFGVPQHAWSRYFARLAKHGLQDRIRGLYRRDADWAAFKKALREEFFLDDSGLMTKKSFIDWVEKANKGLAATTLYHEFESKFGQLDVEDQQSMENQKIELFLKAADPALQEKLADRLEDSTSETGVKTAWADVIDAVNMIARRERMRLRLGSTSTSTSISPTSVEQPPRPSVSFSTQPTHSSSVPSNLPLQNNVMDELIKSMQDLQLNLTEISSKVEKLDGKVEERGRSFAQRPTREGFKRRCIWCDSLQHEKRDCTTFREAEAQKLVFWKDGKIHASETGLPLEPNFGNGGMKKRLEDLAVKTAYASIDAATYGLQIEPSKVNLKACKADVHSEVWMQALDRMEKGKVVKQDLTNASQCIRGRTGWQEPVDSFSAFAHLAEVNGKDKFKEILVEDKRRREEEPNPSSSGPSKRITRRSPEQPKPAENSPPEQIMEDVQPKKTEGKKKGKQPGYKLQSDIETATDLKRVLEERILGSKIEFTLGEILGIAKREFHDVIINVIKRKRQYVGDDAEEAVQAFLQVLRVFVQDEEKLNAQGIQLEAVKDLVSAIEAENQKNMEETEDDNCIVGLSTSIDQPTSQKEGYLQHIHGEEEARFIPSSHYSRTHWARATTETIVKIGERETPCIALLDHGSEINVMARSLYESGGWPIDVDPGWRMKAANNSSGELYAACPNVLVTIGDIQDTFHFFVQDSCSYPIILGQPYISEARLETKALDDGSSYARIRSKDNERAVQFLTVCVNHHRNKDRLRDYPVPPNAREFKGFRAALL